MASKNDITPQKILTVAVRLFARRGYDRTSLDLVAAEVGIRKQSLLYHYSSKEALRQAVLESIFSYWKDVVPRALVEASDGVNRFDKAMSVVVEFFRGDRDRAALVIREALDRPDEMRSLIEEHFHPWLGLVTEYIRRGQRTGQIYSDVDPEAYVIHCIVLSISVIATGDVFQGIYAGEMAGSGVLERLLKELWRLTQAGLFMVDQSSFHDYQ